MKILNVVPGAVHATTWVPVVVVERMAFYELTRRPDVHLAVATGDQRLYANLLLTIGYIDPTAG